jgi:hypothetical protein
MGTALELSYLYTKPWRAGSEDRIFDQIYYDWNNGYAHPPFWYGDRDKNGNWVEGLAKEFTLGGLYTVGHVVVEPEIPGKGPSHFAIPTNHYEAGKQLCFEKQTGHLPNVHYQLKPCDEINIEKIYYPPSNLFPYN